MISSIIENKNAVVCPLCKGDGKGQVNSKYHGITTVGKIPDSWRDYCHGCRGKGWVVV